MNAMDRYRYVFHDHLAAALSPDLLDELWPFPVE
jgi:hypothetical protein